MIQGDGKRERGRDWGEKDCDPIRGASGAWETSTVNGFRGLPGRYGLLLFAQFVNASLSETMTSSETLNLSVRSTA